MDYRLGMAVLIAGAGVILATGAAAELGEASMSAAERRAVAASGLPRASIVSIKPDMVVAIRGRGAPSQGGGVIEGVTLQGEVVSSQMSQALGYRSIRSTVNIDCVRRRDMVVKMTVFTEANAKGVAINRHVPGGWVQPSPDAYLSDVIRVVCASAPRQAISPPAPMESAVPAETEDRPLRTSLDARTGRAPAAASAPVSAAAPASAPASATAAPAAKPVPPPASAPRRPGKVAVQIAAVSTDAQARAALAQVRRRLAPPLSTEVRSAVVDGRTYHRALVTGFQTRAEAQAFCATLKSACFVR